MIIVYMMAAWFAVLLFSDKKYFICSIIILLSCLSNILIVDVFELTEPMSYVDEKGFFIKLDGITAVILTAFYARDKLALKMSGLLIFSVICHTMIIYHLTAHPSFVSNFFYTWYDELITTIGLLQMVISRDGITSALGSIRIHLLRISFYTWCYSKSYTSFKRSGAKS